MFKKIFRPGCRLFAVGSILMLLTAAAHTAGQFATAPNDAALSSVLAAMQGYKLDMGMGMKPSVEEIYYSLAFTMSLLLLFLGVQNLVSIYLAGDSAKLMRSLTMINLLCVVAQVALNWHYRIPPPLISFALISFVFALSLAMPNKREP
jgi:hypothetical protein